MLIDFSTNAVSAAWSTAVSTETALTTPGRARVGPGREAHRRLAARREEEMSGVVVEEDLRPVKVERETRSVEDWVELWWRDVARAKRAWDRVRDVEEAMAQPRRRERFSEREREREREELMMESPRCVVIYAISSNMSWKKKML